MGLKGFSSKLLFYKFRSNLFRYILQNRYHKGICSEEEGALTTCCIWPSWGRCCLWTWGGSSFAALTGCIEGGWQGRGGLKEIELWGYKELLRNTIMKKIKPAPCTNSFIEFSPNFNLKRCFQSIQQLLMENIARICHISRNVFPNCQMF